MDEVNHDRDLELAFAGFGLDPVDLVIVAVDQRDPGAFMLGIAAVGFVEHFGDDRAASSLTLAFSHLFFAFGRVLAAGGGFSGSGRMSATVRGSGVSSYTAAISAIRLRFGFSPLDRRVLSFAGGVLRLRAGLLTQPLGAHHDPLRIAGEHQQILPVRHGTLALLVERINVLAAGERQLSQLTRADLLAGLTRDRGLRVFKA